MFVGCKSGTATPKNVEKTKERNIKQLLNGGVLAHDNSIPKDHVTT